VYTSPKSRQRVFAVPRLAAVTIFSTWTIGSAWPRSSTLPPGMGDLAG
jgi:hypothetical protein